MATTNKVTTESEQYRKAANSIVSEYGGRQRRSTVALCFSFLLFAVGLIILARVTYTALSLIMSPGTAFLTAFLIHLGAAGGVALAASAAGDPPKARGRKTKLILGIVIASTCLLAVVCLAVLRGSVWLDGQVGGFLPVLIGLLFGLAEAAVDVFLGWQLEGSLRRRKECAADHAWAQEVKNTIKHSTNPAAGWINEEERLSRKLKEVEEQDIDDGPQAEQRDREAAHIKELLEYLRARNPGDRYALPRPYSQSAASES